MSLINPEIIQIGALSIRWYGVILALGAVAGLVLAIQEGKRFGIKSDFFMDLLLIGAPTAIIFARIYYVAFQWDYYKNNLGDIIKIWNGGIAIYGAIIGALICGYFFSRAKGYSFWRIADICAPSLLVGQMIGRWGNFVNQEAYGGPVEESFLRETLHIPGFIVDQMLINGTYVHPTFLYESLWSLVGLVLLFVIRRQRFLREGELLATYIGWYSIGRFFIEALRTDSLAFSGPQWLADLLTALWAPMTVLFEQGYLDPAYGNIRSSQLLALLLVVAVIIFIIVRRATGLAKDRYLDPLINTKQAAVDQQGKEKTSKEKHDQRDSSSSDHSGAAIAAQDKKSAKQDEAGKSENGESKPTESNQAKGAGKDSTSTSSDGSSKSNDSSNGNDSSSDSGSSSNHSSSDSGGSDGGGGGGGD
nr:prolipoprotein diacylglyceryl transferase [Paenibacillus montaniterrae]